MKTALAVIVFCFFFCEGTMVVEADISTLNDRPIIGILSQEQAYQLKKVYAKENYTSYIAASYVKALEASGARVVPIMIGKSREYYRTLMGKINGVLFPGGATYFNQTDGYADAGQHIYEIAQEINDNGDHFPIFGTCLGFELLLILASGRGEPENRVDCRAFGNSPLTFTRDYRNSKMFEEIEDNVADWLEHQSVTVNSHQYCIVDENMERHNLTKDWQVTSYSFDLNGLKFISSVEHRRYPFFGVQFHPEKVSFEWSKAKKYVHTQNAIKANRHFMDFFVRECKKNLHTFDDDSEEEKYLIYNYIPTFTGAHGSMFSQCYFFEPKSNVSKL